MGGGVAIVNALKKYHAGIIALAFWAYNAWYAAQVSRLPRYYPERLMQYAGTYGEGSPYPWEPILGTWLLFAIATVGIYFILRKAPFKALFLLAYSIALFAFMTLFTKMDPVGVQYAIDAFPSNALYLAALVGAWSAISLIRARWGKRLA